MEISEAVFRDLVLVAVGRAGRAVGVRAAPDVGPDAVISDIRSRDRSLGDALTSFLDAYEGWIGFHKRIEAEGRQGAMTAEEHGEIVRHIDARDQTRNRFLAELERAEAGSAK